MKKRRIEFMVCKLHGRSVPSKSDLFSASGNGVMTTSGSLTPIERRTTCPGRRRKLHSARCVLAACLGLALAVPVSAEIVVADDGSGGLVLANVFAIEAPSLPAGPRAPAGSPRRPGKTAGADLAPLVAAAAARHDLPEALLKAVIRVESNFNPQAVSAKGATGLMQLMPGTARDLGVRDVRDPAANIDGGAKYLKELLARFGNDLTAALAAYNAGPGAVTRSRGAVPPFAETRQYVPKVLGYYHAFEIDSGRPPR